MNKKMISKLVASSYKGNNLDQKQVNKVTSLLSNTDLKQYINGLKLAEKKMSIVIISPTDSINRKMFKDLYPNKKIVFRKDPSLMLGVKIIDNDMVHEFTLKDSLDKIINYIEQNYD